MIKTKQRSVNIVLIGALMILTAASFGPCMINTSSDAFSGSGISEKTVSFASYLFCIVSAVEIILIFVSARKAVRTIGLILHLFNSVSGILECYFLNKLGELMDDYNSSYSLTQYGYFFLAGCAVVLLLYIADLAEAKKHTTAAEPKSAALLQ